ncbi:hypothetical protein L6164_017307 [Bauhinia variegata]|nr:hypothetical protein L6164_017307 [Bauhinia variegata]
MPVNTSKNVIALALCTLLRSKEEETEQVSYEVQIFINGAITSFFETRPYLCKSDHLWLYYFPQRLISSSMTDCIDVKVSFVVVNELGTRTPFLKAFGVHPISGQSEEMGELGDIYGSNITLALRQFMKDLEEVDRLRRSGRW